MNSSKQEREPRRRTRTLRWLQYRSRRVLYALVSRRVVVNVLLATIAAELTVLGVGLSRRLEMANEESFLVSQAQLAVLEAQALSEENLSRGSAGISAHTATAPDSPDAPPPLRARDVDTILMQETDMGITISREDDPPATPEAETTAPKEENSDIRDETDLLIRKGVAALTAGDMRLCVLCMEEARLLSPDSPAALYYLGVAYDKLLNPLKAREFYTKVFAMRDRAGVYFQRSARRLTYGFEQPGALRGKLSFGPHQMNHTYSADEGESIDILLPVILAPGESVRPDDIYIAIQFFDLVNGRKIEFSRLARPELSWQSESPTWQEWEEHLRISYKVPPLTQEEMDAYGDLKYYGFTAKLYYKGEPLDCISTPSALILQEQRLHSRRKTYTPRENSLFPDDGLAPDESAVPVSDYTDNLLPASDE